MTTAIHIETADGLAFQSLDYGKVRKKLGWKPEYDLASTVKRIYQWYQNYFKSL